MDLMYASETDKQFYAECTKGLPDLLGINGDGLDKWGVPLPYGTGPHSVRCLREIVEIVKPKNIFEIGFNMGWSSAMWLELAPKAKITSCDISYKDETVEAAKYLGGKYPKRFFYVNRLESEYFDKITKNKSFDLAFIDGGHLLDDVVADLKLCMDLNIPFFAMDDWLPEYGEVEEAVKTFGNDLELINLNGNIALLKNNKYAKT